MQGRADVKRGAFGEQRTGGVHHAAAERNPDTLGLDDPEFDRDQVIIASRRLEGEPAFDDGEDGIAFLQGGEGMAERSEEFAAGQFQYVEVTGVVNVVADGAQRIADPVLKAKDLSRHGGRVRRCRAGAN